MRRFLITMACLALAHGAAWGQAADRWRSQMDELSAGGEFRAQYESLDGQFRAGRGASDQALAMRTVLHVQARRGRLRAGLELLDSRAYLTDSGSSIGTNVVNALEPVEAYVAWRVSGAQDSPELLAGRFTLDLGSRRLAGRAAFRNTTNAFTGLRADGELENGVRWTAFYSLVQRRRPSDRTSLLDNEVALDREDGDQRFWGAFATGLPIAGPLKGEAYLYGSEINDPVTDARASQLYTPGVRLFREPAPGQPDLEVEAAVQFGETRAAGGARQGELLDVLAGMLHAEAGWTFAAPWSPRIALMLDYGSGDGDPDDGEINRFDGLYGPRRTDFGPTNLYTALTGVNLISPALRASWKMGSRWDGLADLRWVKLADDADAFGASGVIDPTGRSGDEIGWQWQARLRYWLVPKYARLEVGGAYLDHGDFLREAPNAPGHGDTVYGYSSVTLSY